MAFINIRRFPIYSRRIIFDAFAASTIGEKTPTRESLPPVATFLDVEAFLESSFVADTSCENGVLEDVVTVLSVREAAWASDHFLVYAVLSCNLDAPPRQAATARDRTQLQNWQVRQDFTVGSLLKTLALFCSSTSKRRGRALVSLQVCR